MDHFDRQLDWVTSLSGDDRIAAGSVVAWQGISTALIELVKQFNDANLANKCDDTKRHRETHVKKLIVGMFYELDACLDYWARQLRASGKLTEEIKQKKKAFKHAIKNVGLSVLKEIRNGVAFHFTDYLNDPDALVETYRKLDAITLDQLNDLLKSGLECGYAMRDLVVP